MIVLAMSILLLASMVCMLYFSRKAVKEEATLSAQQTLDGTISRIDNVLLPSPLNPVSMKRARSSWLIITVRTNTIPHW